jgi:hypothetical protein
MIISFAAWDSTALNQKIAYANSATGSFGIGHSNNATLLYSSGSTITPASNLTSGVLAVAGTRAYRNGTVEVDVIPDGGAIGANALVIGARDNVGSIIQFALVTVKMVAIYDITLTQPQIAAVGSAALPLA